jgi:hypothetical protein
MVKIAIAGGSSSELSTTSCSSFRSVPNNLADVAQEILDVLVATKKHEIVLLSRKVRILPYTHSRFHRSG